MQLSDDEYLYLLRGKTQNVGRLLRMACADGRKGVVLKLAEEGSVDLHAGDELMFSHACGSGNLELVKWFLELPNLNLHCADYGWARERALQWAITNKPSSLAIVTMLINTAIAKGSPLDLHVRDNLCFIQACTIGNLPLAKYLYHLADPTKFAFSLLKALDGARDNEHFHVCAWITQLCHPAKL